MYKKYLQYILALMIIIVYGRSLGNDFVWDDRIFLLGNHAYQYFDLYKIFESCANGVEYLPVRDLTYAIDYSLWGENATGFHLTNLLLAIALSIAVLKFTGNLLDMLSDRFNVISNELVAFFVASIFILHPLQAQAVNLLTCRNVLLSGLFFFLSLNFFLRWHRDHGLPRLNMLFSLLMFLLALFSKATVITMPLVMLLLSLYLPGKRRKSIAFSGVMLLMSGAAYFLFKYIALSAKGISQEALVFGALDHDITFLKVLQIPMFYIGKAVLPIGLSPQYDVQFSASVLNTRFLLSFFVCAVLTLLVLFLRKNRMLSFGWLFFLITLLPVANFFSTFPNVADRYAFLPFFGLIMMLVSTGTIIKTAALQRSYCCAMSLILVAAACGSYAQVTVYKDEEYLWERVLKLNPHDSRALVNMGLAYSSQGMAGRGLELMEEASRLDPSKPNYDYSKGLSLFRKGQFLAAEMKFKTALERNDSHLQSLYYAALCSMRKGDAMESARLFREMDESASADVFNFLKKRDMMLGVFVAPRLKNMLEAVMSRLKEKPDDFDLFLAKINLLFVTRNYQQVIDEYQRFTPTSKLQSGRMVTMVGISYRHIGDSNNAIMMLKQAMAAVNPDSGASIPLSRLLVAERRFVEAEDALLRASDAGYARAAAEMASLQFRLSRKSETKNWIGTAIRLDPSLRYRMESLSNKLTAVI